MPRRTSAEASLLGAPLPLFGAEPSLMTVGTPVVLTAYQGDDKRWLFRLKKDDNSPFDLTGYTAAMQFRIAVADSDTGVPVTPTTEVTNPTGGEITVTLASEQSTMLTQPTYVWDLEITETATSWTTTIAAGTLTVTKEVTRLGTP